MTEIARYYRLRHICDDSHSNGIILGSNVNLFDVEKKVRMLLNKHKHYPDNLNKVIMFCVRITQAEDGYAVERVGIIAKFDTRTLNFY